MRPGLPLGTYFGLGGSLGAAPAAAAAAIAAATFGGGSALMRPKNCCSDSMAASKFGCTSSAAPTLADRGAWA
jgi:hypothetical protein